MQIDRLEITGTKHIASYMKTPLHVDGKISGRVCGPRRVMFLSVIADLLRVAMPDKFTYLELGCMFGGSLCVAACHMKEAAEEIYVAIDIFSSGSEGPQIDESTGIAITKEIAIENIRAAGPADAYVVEGSSHDPTKAAEALNLVDGAISLLFIDGDHTAEGVLRDWEDYSSYVRPGGVVVFDDYWANGWEGVTEAVDAIDFEGEGFDDIGPLNPAWICDEETGEEQRTHTMYVVQRRDNG